MSKLMTKLAAVAALGGAFLVSAPAHADGLVVAFNFDDGHRVRHEVREPVRVVETRTIYRGEPRREVCERHRGHGHHHGHHQAWREGPRWHEEHVAYGYGRW